MVPRITGQPAANAAGFVLVFPRLGEGKCKLRELGDSGNSCGIYCHQQIFRLLKTLLEMFITRGHRRPASHIFRPGGPVDHDNITAH